jgi:DNA-binding transcriptional regulator YdaS (Cro superfamily)
MAVFLGKLKPLINKTATNWQSVKNGCPMIHCTVNGADRQEVAAKVAEMETHRGSRSGQVNGVAQKTELPCSRVAAPGWHGAKAQRYHDMSSFRNAAGRDAAILTEPSNRARSC